ncbi:MAG: phosphoglucosamine mutase [Nitrososphaerota archaeon]
MKIKYFGTSGIRGIVEENLTPEFTVKIGLSYARFLGNKGSIALGSDQRLGSRVVKHSIISGLIAGGVNIIDLGIIPTPALCHYIKEFKLDGGIMITGSHTPPEITGIMFFQNDTGELRPENEEKIEEIIIKEKYKRVPWNEIGKIEKDDNAIEIYIKNVLRNFGKKFSLNEKIAIDCCNGPQSYALPKIIEEINCIPIILNGEIDGRFPGRDPYPRPENLREICNIVKKEKAILGLACDGDGDRAIFIDDGGNVLWGDITGAIFSEEELKKHNGGIIVCPINTSKIIEDVAHKNNGKIIFTKVGPPAIIEQVVKNIDKVVFAFEETGKYIWKENILYGDPCYSLLKIIEIINSRGYLSKITQSYMKYYSKKIALPIKKKDKKRILNEIEKKIIKKSKYLNMDKLDGFKIYLDEDTWILLRPSGTEPVFRIYIEGKEKEKIEKILEEYVRKIKKII